MTTQEPEGLGAAILQLAAHGERLAVLDDREHRHFAELGGALEKLGTQMRGLDGKVTDHGDILRSLDGLDEIVRDLADRVSALLPDDGEDGPERGYAPNPTIRWWELDRAIQAALEGSIERSDAIAKREAAVARLRSWVNTIYVPYYGRLAGLLGACWEQHNFCLVQLDWLHELWSVLYLQPKRDDRGVGAQSEFAVRILPAAAVQLRDETSPCDRHATPGRMADPWATATPNGRPR